MCNRSNTALKVHNYCSPCDGASSSISNSALSKHYLAACCTQHNSPLFPSSSILYLLYCVSLQATHLVKRSSLTPARQHCSSSAPCVSKAVTLPDYRLTTQQPAHAAPLLTDAVTCQMRQGFLLCYGRMRFSPVLASEHEVTKQD